MYVHMYCIGSLDRITCCADNRLARKVRHFDRILVFLICIESYVSDIPCRGLDIRLSELLQHYW